MVSLAQCRTSQALQEKGFHPVSLPYTDNTPIPGLILFADEQHRQLLVILGDGRVVDLLSVWRLAEDCVRNWQREGKMPAFVGDFKRLTPLAEALNGKSI